MEFTNEIDFDKKITENNPVKISYRGKLFREFSQEAFIVYGYGPNWNNTQEQKMDLTENCFLTEVNITGKETFNFCFRNNFNIWDNNNTFNYISPIFPEDEIKSNSSTSSNSETSNFEGNSSESTPSEENVTNDESNAESNGSNEENSNNSTENFYNETNLDTNEDQEFEALLESLLGDIKSSNDINMENENLVHFGLENFGTINESPNEELDNLFNQISENDFSNNEKIVSEQDLNDAFEKVFNYNEDDELSDELESLMNNILESVIESDSVTNESSNENLFDTAVKEQTDKFDTELLNAKIEEKNDGFANEINSSIKDYELPTTISTSKIDAFFDASYEFIQNIGLACRKLGSLIKAKAQEFGFIKGDK